MQTQVTRDEPLRFYHLMLQPDLLGGWVLIREWGYQGARGRTQRDLFSDHHSAQDALLQVRDAQLRRGFRVVFMERGDQP